VTRLCEWEIVSDRTRPESRPIKPFVPRARHDPKTYHRVVLGPPVRHDARHDPAQKIHQAA
jgi:hypothetical protein